jgi:hypothetical protein
MSSVCLGSSGHGESVAREDDDEPDEDELETLVRERACALKRAERASTAEAYSPTTNSSPPFSA